MKSIINYIDKVSVELAKRVSTYEKGASYLKDVQSFFALNQKEKVFGRSMDPTIQSVEFRDVSFAYPGSKQKVLNHFSLKLEDGKQYAIVGENGAGKSTLIKLLMGVYDSYEGEILINGVDIRSYDEQSLRDLFSYVPQDVTRYEISLDEYLKVRDREKIEQIFDEYGIDFMPDSKDKIMLGRLEEGAIDLSGGQWQLLAIVRACVNEKNINILDEPTAAIDPIREAELYYTFQKVLQKRFAILITHRLGAAKMANEIIAIKDGRVAERGSHEELMSRKGMYAQMYALQKKWYE